MCFQDVRHIRCRSTLSYKTAYIFKKFGFWQVPEAHYAKVIFSYSVAKRHNIAFYEFITALTLIEIQGAKLECVITER